jgi:glycosyltransferase involved in cell wall biosynthesis
VRVALVAADWRPTGGVATYTRALAGALARADHEVLVVHGDADAPPSLRPSSGPADGAAAPFRVVCVPDALSPAAGRNASLIRAAFESIAAFAPDVVHVVSGNNFPLEDALLARGPVVKTFHVHEYCPAGTKFHFGPERACDVRTGPMCVARMGYLRCTLSRRPNVWWSLYQHTATANRHHRRFKQLIVCSDHIKRQAVFTGFDADRLAVVPYFTERPARAAVPATARREVLFVGRLVRAKGADLLLDALARVPGAWTASIAGSGLELEPLRRQALALGLGDRVSFPGWLNGAALDAAYSHAAVVAVPSRWPEPFGIVGLEAMAHGRPVVAFNVGGVPEWLDDGVGGWLVPPGDVAALARRIAATLEHPEDATRIAKAGHERVAHEFSAAAHLARLLPIYARVRGVPA